MIQFVAWVCIGLVVLIIVGAIWGLVALAQYDYDFFTIVSLLIGIIVLGIASRNSHGRDWYGN